jgi:H+-translocating NAD(P) transhydrogenase subunit alpha
VVIIAVPAEGEDEPRVAVSPETVKKFKALGVEVRVASGAGERSRFSDQLYADQGAVICPSSAEAISGADIIIKVRRPSAADIAAMKPGAIVAANLDPFGPREGLDALANAGVDAFSMEFMPRISRAQTMDVLSSQANLAGYRAVVDGAAYFDRALPMMMTAAGTVPAARIFIMGVGVAGLQAIATARRMGAIVTATDVRPATKEQVESLGAKFVAVVNDEFKQAETSAGYAKEMSDDYKRQQAELVTNHIKNQDIIITTALIPGRPAPKLVTRAQVESLRPGSVIIDLAAERGGNCELTETGQVVQHNDVTIVGHVNVAAKVAVNASSLYARNLFAFLEISIDKKTGELAVNWDDEIIKGTLVTHGGAIVHPTLTGGKA